MQFAFTPEQSMIRDTAQAYVEEHGESARVRAASESADGFDRSSWTVLMQELGFGGIALPEVLGGAGLGIVELASVQEMLGRSLMPTPFLCSIGLAATFVAEAGTLAQQAALLPGIIAGTEIATLAYCGEKGGADLGSITMRLTAEGALEGDACFVQFAHAATTILCAARDPAGKVVVVAIPSDAPGLVIERLTMMDTTRPMCRIRCSGVMAAADALFSDAAPALEKTLRIGAVLVASECVGGAEAALHATNRYMKEREQFGRPIGSFQAIKHRMADVMIAVESAKGLAWYAAATADEAPEALIEAASVAKVGCSEAMMKCAGDMIQLHGGIGFTWEHDAHLFFKRARGALTLLGAPDWHRAIIMAEIERGAAA